MANLNWDELTKKQKESVSEQSTYDMKDLETEQPYFIDADNWNEYADEQLDEMLGLRGRDINSLCFYLDYEKWENDLSYDYTEIEIDGDTFLFRAW